MKARGLWTGAAVVTGVLAGCSGGETTIHEVAVDPYLSICHPWDYYYLCPGTGVENGVAVRLPDIEGFEFEWGVTQVIRYVRHELDDPPADGSSVEAFLDEVLDRIPDPVGTPYKYRYGGGEEPLFTDRIGNQLVLYGEVPVACEPALCDEIIAWEGRFEVTLALTADPAVPLEAVAIEGPP